MAIGSFGAIVLAEAFKLHLAVDRPLLPLCRFVPPRPYPTPSHSPLLLHPSPVVRSVEPISACFQEERRGMPDKLRRITNASSHNFDGISDACACVSNQLSCKESPIL